MFVLLYLCIRLISTVYLPHICLISVLFLSYFRLIFGLFLSYFCSKSSSVWSELSSSQALLEAAEFDTELFAAYTQDWQDRVRVIGKYVRTCICMCVYVCMCARTYMCICICVCVYYMHYYRLLTVYWTLILIIVITIPQCSHFGILRCVVFYSTVLQSIISHIVPHYIAVTFIDSPSLFLFARNTF